MTSNHRDFRTQIVTGVIDSIVRQGQEWRVRVYGVYWSALTKEAVEFFPGDSIQVIGRQNTKLLITAK